MERHLLYLPRASVNHSLQHTHKIPEVEPAAAEESSSSGDSALRAALNEVLALDAEGLLTGSRCVLAMGTLSPYYTATRLNSARCLVLRSSQLYSIHLLGGRVSEPCKLRSSPIVLPPDFQGPVQIVSVPRDKEVR